jgi:2-oxoglutarate ferredoxin oxidoreductase subunit alpha
MLLGDGMIGQMMEPVALKKPEKKDLPEKTWACTGWDGKTRPRAIINSLYIDPAVLEKHNQHLQAKYAAMEREQVRVEVDCPEDTELVLVAYGTVARIASKAIAMARAQGVKVGLVRPITLGRSRARRCPTPLRKKSSMCCRLNWPPVRCSTT